MVRRWGPGSDYFACTGYPECKNIVDENPAPPPRVTIDPGARWKGTGRDGRTGEAPMRGTILVILGSWLVLAAGAGAQEPVPQLPIEAPLRPPA